MADILTMPEIEARYPDQWILIGDPETDEALHVLRGTVLWHSPDRDEVYDKAIELRPRSSAFHCTKRLPDNVVIIL